MPQPMDSDLEPCQTTDGGFTNASDWGDSVTSDGAGGVKQRPIRFDPSVITDWYHRIGPSGDAQAPVPGVPRCSRHLPVRPFVLRRVDNDIGDTPGLGDLDSEEDREEIYIGDDEQEEYLTNLGFLSVQPLEEDNWSEFLFDAIVSFFTWWPAGWDKYDKFWTFQERVIEDGKRVRNRIIWESTRDCSTMMPPGPWKQWVKFNPKDIALFADLIRQDIREACKEDQSPARKPWEYKRGSDDSDSEDNGDVTDSGNGSDDGGKSDGSYDSEEGWAEFTPEERERLLEEEWEYHQASVKEASELREAYWVTPVISTARVIWEFQHRGYSEDEIDERLVEMHLCPIRDV
ncbi:hypothetical protein FA13DRAFT_1803267 [Coprinellus micaceus]|uniref:Uncharacterized protein n=1 Tax=Coprinellus micaceus TaxID=71717 RepID=A0A4Y7SAI9_COPMI|nr:hypothetical protein FA13DRAFT_1803267 [Coprinellus micaceus]